ncbi:L-fuculokinase [Conservatibacter flavescens]|uniref:L-fuculokinase n=1 Tax=Conservatibacter flavescens TaxID=28161 RepID=A0A2M8S4C4_9PAST|nr:L-fuculokinase [Conservatibacter flavescens]PJG85999.1 L-fuculokinase [Conservatibacter flavescens]
MAIVLIFDCGATNLRTIAINEKGKILASCHLPNATQTGAEQPNYHVWDFEEIWQKLLYCAERTLGQLKQRAELTEVVGISVTTFGVDGAPFDHKGRQLYPIISWKCPRTIPIMANLSQYLDVEKLYQRNGIGQYSFNTLFKLLWLKERQPEVFANMDKWVFISSMLTQRLTGEFTTDRTMAGTSMMTELATENWDVEVLAQLGLTPSHFPRMVNTGEKIGELSTALCKQLGLHSVPVISCGHDTQFAIFGSGAGLNQPVLSSGTWEILMSRTAQAKPSFEFMSQGLTTEFDIKPTYFTPAVQWVGSGVIEWIGKLLFPDVFGTKTYYTTMMAEGENAHQSAVNFDGIFHQIGQGKITGLSVSTTRGEVYRAALEYMANQLKNGLQMLQQVSDFKATSIICVGGGSKNPLWNQIRANTLNLPIDIVDVAESTVLGAAMCTLAAVGVYGSPDEAQQAMKPKYYRIYPNHH